MALRAREIIAERKIAATTHLIANRPCGEEDLEQVRAALGDGNYVAVPEDAAISRADVDGLSPLDAAPHAPAIEALAALARSWTRQAT